jgi:hypothetical protein
MLPSGPSNGAKKMYIVPIALSAEEPEEEAVLSSLASKRGWQPLADQFTAAILAKNVQALAQPVNRGRTRIEIADA